MIVIVLLVVRLSKTGSNSTTGGSTTPPTTSSSAAAPPSTFTLVQAPKVDNKYPLNLAAARTSTTLAASETAVARALHAAGGGHVTKDVVAMYDLTSVTSPSDSNFQAISFLGYEGTFNENNVIDFEQTQLKSSRAVKAGPDGGKMICGYATTTGGTEASECVWVTKDTFGQVQFIVGSDGGEAPGRRYLGPGGQGGRGGPRLAAPAASGAVDSPVVSRPVPIDLPPQYAPAEVEGPRYERWEKAGYFTAGPAPPTAPRTASSSRRRTSRARCTSATRWTTR